MKKLFVIALSLGAFIAMASCSSENNDLSIHDQNSEAGVSTKSAIDPRWDKILSIHKYSEDYSEELSHTENKYDEDMKLINAKTYLKGTLSNELTDYAYNGTNVKFNSYSYEQNGSGRHAITTYEYVYKDKTYNEWSSMSIYIDGPEYHRQEYSYNDMGKHIGFRTYTYNTLEQSMENYVYDDKKVTFYDNKYNSEGIIVGIYKNEILFSNNRLDINSILSHTQYLGDDKEIAKDEYSYDEYGRRNGHTSYTNGVLELESKNYIYNDDECELTYDTYVYYQGKAEIQRIKVKYLKS